MKKNSYLIKLSKYVPLIIILIAGILLGFCNRENNRELSEEERRKNLYNTYDDEFKQILTKITGDTGKEIMKYETIGPLVLTKKVTLTGSHYDLGYQLGLIGKEVGIIPEKRNTTSQALNEEIEAMYRDIYPQFLDKARGAAEANGLSLNEVDLTHLESDYFTSIIITLFKYDAFESLTDFSRWAPSCSLATYFLKENKACIVGRNFDYFFDVPAFLVISGMDGVYRSIANTGWAIDQWIMDGINEKGLFIGGAANEDPPKYKSYGHKPYPGEPAVHTFHLMRVLLDRCAGVDEALEILVKTREWSPTTFMHFLLADRTGSAVVIEWDEDGRLVTFPGTGDFLHVTNTALQEGTDYVYSRCWRYRIAYDLLSEGVDNLSELRGIMETIQMPDDSGARTLWRAMVNLSKLEMHLYFWREDHAVRRTFGF